MTTEDNNKYHEYSVELSQKEAESVLLRLRKAVLEKQRWPDQTVNSAFDIIKNFISGKTPDISSFPPEIIESAKAICKSLSKKEMEFSNKDVFISGGIGETFVDRLNKLIWVLDGGDQVAKKIEARISDEKHTDSRVSFLDFFNATAIDLRKSVKNPSSKEVLTSIFVFITGVLDNKVLLDSLTKRIVVLKNKKIQQGQTENGKDYFLSYFDSVVLEELNQKGQGFTAFEVLYSIFIGITAAMNSKELLVTLDEQLKQKV